MHSLEAERLFFAQRDRAVRKSQVYKDLMAAIKAACKLPRRYLVWPGVLDVNTVDYLQQCDGYAVGINVFSGTTTIRW